jgi:hypothetical protein
VPALTMRGRYLMREYWSDSDLFLRLTADQRELYVGLWMLADDDGWMPRDIPAIAAALYRFVDRQPREDAIRSGIARLRALGKVETHKCACLFLPAVARYPRAGKKSTDHHTEHRKHLTITKPIQTTARDGDKRIQRDLKPSPVVFPSLPDVAGARGSDEPTTETEFQRLVARPA